MNTSTYFILGSVVAVVSVSIYLLPVAYLLWLKARAFIADDKTPHYEDDSPEGKVRTCFSWRPGVDDWVDVVVLCAFMALLAFVVLLAWPLLVIGAAGFAVLWVLRLAARLQRHSEDAARHVADRNERK